MEKVNIIAEAGTNHNGNINTARELIDIASESSADYVKFQIIYPELLYLPGDYWYGPYDIKEVIAMRKKFMLKDEEYHSLVEYSQSKNINFTASVFDKKGVELLAGFNPDFIKIASTDLINLQLLRAVAEKKIRMIMSTGMSTLSDIEKAVNAILKTGFDDIVLMHCVSVYPSKLENMNLGFIDTLKSAFGFPVGLSDHTQNSIAACLALTKRVSYIEKHFTLDASQEGFDHTYAAEPEQLRNYIQDIRKSAKALERPKKKLMDDEIYIKRRARRSIYAAKNIKKGDLIKESDLLIVRPENILSADMIDLVVGKKARTDINKFEPLSFESI